MEEKAKVSNCSTPARKRNLTEVEAKGLLSKAGIPVVETRLARNEQEAVVLSEQLGFPVVIKIVSPEISHKSDVGGVRLGLKDSASVIEAYRQMVSSIQRACPQAMIEGVSVQKMMPPGVEVIIGVIRDVQFGPLLMFGLGGVLVEILKDVSFRIVPISLRDARQMVRDVKCYPLLNGYRGREPVDIPSIENLLMELSSFVDEHPEIVELDLNPVLAHRDGVVVVDARMTVECSW